MGNSTATSPSDRPAFMTEESSAPQSIPPSDPPTAATTTTTSSGSKGSNNLPKIIMGLGVLLLIFATGAGVILTRNQQLTTSQAADCARYNFTVDTQGVVTVINGSTATVPPNNATVSVNNAQVGSFNIPSLAPGQSSQLGSVEVPETGAFVWEVTSPSTSCSDGGNYTATTGTSTETTAPSPSNLAQCTAVVAYSPTWTALTTSDLAALKAGNKVRFVATANGLVDMVKFTINGVETPEVKTLQPGTDNYYYEYTIPATATTFKVTAQVHDGTTDAWY